MSAVLRQWDGVPLVPVLGQNVTRVFHEMKWLVVLSVAMPRVLQALQGWRGRGQEKGSASPPQPHCDWADVLQTSTRQLLRRMLAVLVMPAVFWLTMLPLVTNVLGGPRRYVFRHKWFLALLPMFAGACANIVEGTKRAKVLAVFMACTAVS